MLYKEVPKWDLNPDLPASKAYVFLLRSTTF